MTRRYVCPMPSVFDLITVEILQGRLRSRAPSAPVDARYVAAAVFASLVCLSGMQKTFKIHIFSAMLDDSFIEILIVD